MMTNGDGDSDSRVVGENIRNMGNYEIEKVLIRGKTKTVQWHIAVVELYIDLQSKASLQERRSLEANHI